MPDPSRSTRPATADTRSKGSDHDHDADESEDGHGTADGRPNTQDGDHADGPQDADQPDADSLRDGGQGTATRGAESVVGPVLALDDPLTLTRAARIVRAALARRYDAV
ncbi:hypothetical protein DMC64_24400 [Amycolatopsis sp. WAC 04197]|nr:hypothetical protein DMC64_24400 [Amycolatopsis sp. WAC 04197]